MTTKKNTRHHISLLTWQKLLQFGWPRLTDLSRSDYHFFRPIQQFLHAERIWGHFHLVELRATFQNLANNFEAVLKIRH